MEEEVDLLGWHWLEEVGPRLQLEEVEVKSQSQAVGGYPREEEEETNQTVDEEVVENHSAELEVGVRIRISCLVEVAWVRFVLRVPEEGDRFALIAWGVKILCVLLEVEVKVHYPLLGEEAWVHFLKGVLMLNSVLLVEEGAVHSDPRGLEVKLHHGALMVKGQLEVMLLYGLRLEQVVGMLLVVEVKVLNVLQRAEVEEDHVPTRNDGPRQVDRLQEVEVGVPDETGRGERQIQEEVGVKNLAELQEVEEEHDPADSLPSSQPPFLQHDR